MVNSFFRRPVFTQELLETENGKHILVLGTEPFNSEEKEKGENPKLSDRAEDWFIDRVVDKNKNSN